jgi:FtsH-binding integral membrane protein
MFQKSYPLNPLAPTTSEGRALFIRRTYSHLAAAIVAFILFEYVLLQLEISYVLTEKLFSMQYGWLMVIGGFMLITWMARSMVAGQSSKGTQYAGLSLYVFGWSVMFVPMLILANHVAGGGVIAQAGIMTGLLFAGLTATVFITRKDFSFLRSVLSIGGMVALGLIVCAVIFGFSLGLWFSVAMIALMAAAILYDTSRILHTYGEDQYVGAALELFASVAMMFWYVLRLLMQLRR